MSHFYFFMIHLYKNGLSSLHIFVLHCTFVHHCTLKQALICLMLSVYKTFHQMIKYGRQRSYTIKRRIYVFVCFFSLSVKRFTNRLTQTRKIGNDCRVNFSWSSEHIFNFLCFVIQKLRVFLKNELNDLAYASRKQNTRDHYSRYVTEGGAKMLIRRFRNNDTTFRKYWRGTKFRVINSKAIMIRPREICKILLTPQNSG